MPIQKDFKRLVRARMKKTGESYTAARARLLERRPKRASGPAAAPAQATAPSVADYARISGFSDAVIKARTGCTWKKWVDSLDYHGARAMSHAGG